MPPCRFHLHDLIAAFALAGTAALLPFAAAAADFASSGAQGTLTVKVTAIGGAKHKAGPGAGLDAREWKINNAAQFTIRLQSLGAVPDTSPENQANAAAARDAYQQTVTDKNQAVMDSLDKKMEACQGDGDCIARVAQQMTADPGFQQMTQNMQAAGPGIAHVMQGVSLGPSQQIWMTDQMDPSPASGTVRLDVTEKTYGVIDTAGGGKVDVTCRLTSNQEIKSGSPESKIGASMVINTKTSTYEVRIPANEISMSAIRSCSDSKTGSQGLGENEPGVKLIGRSPPRGVASFAQLLTFKGPIGSSKSPQLSGKETVTTDWIDANHPEPIPVNVTIEWQFSAAGR